MRPRVSVATAASAAAVSALLLLLQHSQGVVAGSCKGTSFQYLLLVEQWPPTSCEHFGCHSDADYTTLHGLWPQDYDGNYPCNCNGPAFNATALNPIMSELSHYWPSLKCTDGSCNNGFWEHEWSKHGTCASQLSALKSEIDFFSTTLKLRAQFDPITAFASAGITPDNHKSYKFYDLKDAFKAAYGGYPAIMCDHYNNYAGVDICLSNSLQVIDCPDSVNDRCSTYKDVWIPTSTPSRRNLRAQQ